MSNQSWRGRRSDQKIHHAHCMLRRCSGDHNSGKKEEEGHGACFSQRTRCYYHGRERVGLANIVPTKKRLSMSYGLRLSPSSAADSGYINSRLVSLLPSSYYQLLVYWN